MNKEYEIIIVGGSYAGLAAGMGLGRALRKVLIVDAGEPCNRFTPYSHNFLTNDGKPPADIAASAKDQLRRYDSVDLMYGLVAKIEREGSGFSVLLANNDQYFSAKVILATGVRDVIPDIPGLSACWGKSVLHCPYCHGYEVRNQNTGVLANGEAAYELSILISQWTKQLTLFTNGESTLSANQEELLKKNGISICEDPLSHIDHRQGNLERIVLHRDKSIALKALYLRPNFEQHLSFDQLPGCDLTEDGYFKVDAAQRTNVPGIFACGDNANRMRTVASAVAAGTVTAFMVNRELIEDRIIRS